MTQVTDRSDVLTLSEAAEYLRLPEATLRELIVRQGLPGRQIGDEWRFLRAALDDWLRWPSGKQALLQQAGALADAETLPALLNEAPMIDPLKRFDWASLYARYDASCAL